MIGKGVQAVCNYRAFWARHRLGFWHAEMVLYSHFVKQLEEWFEKFTGPSEGLGYSGQLSLQKRE